MKGATAGSHPHAQEIAQQVLEGGGSALKAALSGFFGLAGAEPGVLFSPLTILIGGIGSGVRVFDGRARQPGLQGKRPRGFLDNEVIPAAAHAAMPGSINAASLACAYHTGTSLLSCIRVGEAEAKRANALGRQALLEQLAGRGTQALGEGALRRSFLAEFGAAAQGNLALADLTTTPEVDHEAHAEKDAYQIPWASPKAERTHALGEPHVQIAVDVSGLFVAVSFRDLPSDCVLSDYDVYIPALAEPVLRGVTRPVPGTPLPCPSNLYLLRGNAGQLIGVEASRADVSAGETHCDYGIYRNPETKEVSSKVAPALLDS